MKKNDWKKREGVVYSTNEDFAYQYGALPEEATLPPERQQLRVELDRSGRAGKQVTIITGFLGGATDREGLCKLLKTRCGVGGAVKGNDILIQGDARKKVSEVLTKAGYRTRVI